jgi:hypothetical protein
MTYIDIYNKLSVVKNSNGNDLPIWQRIKLTFRISHCSLVIQDEIYKYLETQEQPDYSLKISFTDKKSNSEKETNVSCQDIQNKMRLQPLPALLYMDWLRRKPEQAAAFVLRKDDLPQIPIEMIRTHIDPNLLEKADKVRKEKEQNDLSIIDGGE